MTAAEMRARPLGHDSQVAGRAVEALAVRGADHDVLDPRSPAIRDVDPRLHAERVALAQRLRIGFDQVRLLVGLQSDAVAGAMGEQRSVAGVGDDFAGDAVDVPRRNPGSNGVAGRGLASWRTAYRSWNSSGGMPTNAVRVVSLA